MSGINPRSAPIALILAGAIIISAMVSAYAYGQRTDSTLTLLVALGFVIGFISILVGAGLYYWERHEYYEHVV
jgi:hypothetical protein